MYTFHDATINQFTLYHITYTIESVLLNNQRIYNLRILFFIIEPVKLKHN
jgi:hypothetical protein